MAVLINMLLLFQGSKREGTKRGRKPGRKAKSDMKAKLGEIDFMFYPLNVLYYPLIIITLFYIEIFLVLKY